MGRFRTRVITNGVVPSLHVDYKHAKVKQYHKEGRALRTETSSPSRRCPTRRSYHKEGRALRTETTINDTRDLGIGKRLCNLPALAEVGFRVEPR